MKEVVNKITQARHIALLTHVNPDADTLGSALGFYHVLKNIGKKATVINTTTLPYNLDFLPGIERVQKSLPKGVDLMVSFDCGSFDRLGLGEKSHFLINFDHHTSNTNYGEINIIDADAASTSEVVFDFCQKYGLEVTKDAALCFYTALVDDCGFFKYDSVQAKTFDFAKELCKRGVVPEVVANNLTMREPLSKLRLLPMVLETLELKMEGRVAIVMVTQEMLQRSGGTKEMADDALNMARSLATVEIAILLREEEDGRIKVSLRSKEYADVSKIAVSFGGGGHRRAAGFTSNLTNFQEVLALVLEKIKEEIRD